MNAPTHLSVFELDTWFASSETERTSGDGLEVTAHLATCAACRGHIEAMGGSAPNPNPNPIPSRPLLRLVPPIATALALAAVVVLWLRAPRTSDEASYIGVKGAPAAQVLVRSQGRVRVWDGSSPVRSGDALAVRVACEAFDHAAVVADDDAGFARAWDGPCPLPGADSTLPFTLVVDNRPGREHFVLVLSHGRLDDAPLEVAARGLDRVQGHDAQTWPQRFDFAKEESR